MSWLVAIGILAALGYSAYSGTKRGMVLIGLELVSFMAATYVALGLYHPVGLGIEIFAHVTAALGNVVAFVGIWTITEVACALIIRFVLLPHLHRHLRLSPLRRAGGAVLNALKAAAVITLGLIVFAGLPLSAAAKRPVTGAPVAGQLLAASGGLQAELAAGLGHDINDSLNFFTVTAEPESDERIDLHFTTTNVAAAPAAETAMLTLLNHERTSRGLPELALNTKARAVARANSADMFAEGYFSHISPDGKSPFDRMRAGGVDFGSAGENLALAPNLQLAHDGLMKSPGHRANILSTSYRTVGIGIVDGGPYGLMVTQDFTD